MDLKSAIKAVSPAVVQIRAISAPRQGHALGTGFLVNEDAHVVTAKHVIDGARHLAAKVGSSLQLGVGLAHENTENMRGPISVLADDRRLPAESAGAQISTGAKGSVLTRA